MTNLEAKVTEINIKLNRLCRCFCSRVATCLGIDTEDHSALFLAKDGTWKPTTSYFKYVAILKGSGGATDPDPFVQENTLGNTIVWTHQSTGVYNGYLDTSLGDVHGFEYLKTVILGSSNASSPNSLIMTIRYVDLNNIIIETRLTDGTYIDGLELYSIEIRVYP